LKRLASSVSRAGCAVSVFLLVLAVLRWAPVHAEPPWEVPARNAGAAAVVFAAVAASTGRERKARPFLPWVVGGLAATGLALAAAVALRGPAGLAAEVREPSGSIARLPLGPIDLIGRDLRERALGRKWSTRWAGELRAPEAGRYRLWAAGGGRVTVILDDRDVLSAEGERFVTGNDVALARGAHRLAVAFVRTVPAARLRLGWIRPGHSAERGGRAEVIPPRYLGSARSRVAWAVIDGLALLGAALAAALVWVLPWDRPRRLAVPTAVRVTECAWSGVGYVVLVAVMSWPLVRDLAGLGMTDRPDGRLNAWILAWDVHALWHQPSRLFQAPIFHPLPDALAFSENLLVPALVSAPAQLAAGPILAYNIVLLLSMVVSGLGVELLARRAGAGRLAAFVGGAAFAVGAHRWIRLAHLHAQVTLFLPFALLALDRFWERRSLRRALALGLLLALQGLSSVYIGAIAALAMAVGVAAALAGGLRGREAARLGAGLLLAAILVAPAVVPYMRMRTFQGVEWSLAQVSSFAATPESYAASGTRLYGGLTQRHLDPDRVRDTLFPGLVSLVLGLVGLAAAPKRYRAFALLASAVAILASLGPETAAYRFLHQHLVLVRGVRALARFSLLPVLCLSVLTGLALSARRRIALPALAFLMIESSNVPIRYAAAPRPSELARWLAGREGAIAYLPLGERDTEVMLDGVAHFRPLVNGDSGFVPRPYTRAMELLARRPDDDADQARSRTGNSGSLPLRGEAQVGGSMNDALRLLRALGVGHVVTRDQRPWLLIARFGEDRVYAIEEGPEAEMVVPSRPAVSLWAGPAALVDLGAERVVSEIVFQISEAPWVERPLLTVSADGMSWSAVRGEASLADATLSLYRDPRRALGRVRFAPTRTRFVRLDPALPLQPGVLWAGPED
jgi:hypothetical protein